MLLRKHLDRIPVSTLVCRIRPREAIPTNLSILSNYTIIGKVQCRVPRTENGLADILYLFILANLSHRFKEGDISHVNTMVLMAVSRKARLVAFFVFDNDVSDDGLSLLVSSQSDILRGDTKQ